MSTRSDDGDGELGAPPVSDVGPLDDVDIRPIATMDVPFDEEKLDVTTKSIAEKQEDTRKLIAIVLLVGLALVSVGWTLVGILGDGGDIATGGAALDKIFTGILGLTGTAVGFYFGTAGPGGSSKSNGGGR